MPAVLFQTGYLTIRGYEERGCRRSYTLGFPNHEVEDGFNAWLADAYTKDAAATSSWRNGGESYKQPMSMAAWQRALLLVFRPAPCIESSSLLPNELRLCCKRFQCILSRSNC